MGWRDCSGENVLVTKPKNLSMIPSTHGGRELTSTDSSLTFVCLNANFLTIHTHTVINFFKEDILLLGMVVHTFNPSTRGGKGCQIPVRYRLAWST